jgi:hypothetical protein
MMKKLIATILTAASIVAVGSVATADAGSTVDRVVTVHTTNPLTNPIQVDLASDTRFRLDRIGPHRYRIRVFYGDGTVTSFRFGHFTYMTVSVQKAPPA